MGQGTQFDAVGHGVQQCRRQQPLHHRQDPGDIGIAPAEIVVAINVGEEKARGGAPSGVFKKMPETAFEALRLPSPHLAQPWRTVARFPPRIVHCLVAGQPSLQPLHAI